MPPKTMPWKGADRPPVEVAGQARAARRSPAGGTGRRPRRARPPCSSHAKPGHLHLGPQPQQPAGSISSTRQKSSASPTCSRCGSRRPRRSPTPPTSRSSQPRTDHASGNEYQPFSPPMPVDDPPQRSARRRDVALPLVGVQRAAGPVRVGGQRVGRGAGRGRRRPAGLHVGVADLGQRQPRPPGRSRSARRAGRGT